MSIDEEIDRNLFAFLTQVPDLLADHRGDFALLKSQRVVSIHSKLSQALAEGAKRFSDGLFSIQQITDKPIELGFFSYAEDHR